MSGDRSLEPGMQFLASAIIYVANKTARSLSVCAGPSRVDMENKQMMSGGEECYNEEGRLH